jgi:hypothetical protein
MHASDRSPVSEPTANCRVPVAVLERARQMQRMREVGEQHPLA